MHQDDEIVDGAEDTSKQQNLDELLTLASQFFNQASPTVHDELRQFLTDRGYHPISCLGWFLDSLAFSTYRPST